MYLSIHYVPHLEAKQFSLVRANIEATPEREALARELYPEPAYWIELHPCKYDMKPVITQP